MALIKRKQEPWQPAWRDDVRSCTDLVGRSAADVSAALAARELAPRPSTLERRFAAPFSRVGGPLSLPLDPKRDLDPRAMLQAMARGACWGIGLMVRARRAAPVDASADPVESASSDILTGGLLGGVMGAATSVLEQASEAVLREAPDAGEALTLAALGEAALAVEEAALAVARSRGLKRPPRVIWRILDGLTPDTSWTGVGSTRERTAAAMMAAARRKDASRTQRALWRAWELGCAVEAVTAAHVVVVAPRLHLVAAE